MVDYFGVTLTIGHERARLQLRGELDFAAARELSVKFDEARAAGPPLIIVDLAQLSYCDSSGIHVLVQAAAWCESNGIDMRLTCVRPYVRRVFELTDTADLLHLDTDMSETDVRPLRGPIEQPLTRCPDCDCENLRVVADSQHEDVQFRCSSCGACWRVELGYVHRAGPARRGRC
jgi:anti-sigma B factor antagonist